MVKIIKKNVHQKLKKFDLHLHTFASDKDDKTKFVNIDEKNVDKFIEKLLDNKIELIAITNHNLFNFDQYQLIKKYSKNEFTIIPGVEITIYYGSEENEKKIQCNLLFDNLDEAKIKFNSKLINEELNKFNKRDGEKNSLQKFLWQDFLSFSEKLSGRFIFIVDYDKSSSNLNSNNNWIKSEFWFYFDMYEGNKKKSRIEIDNKFKKIIDDETVKIKPYILGTDNRDYKKYPQTNNKNNNNWTGTYFFVDNTFNGLLSAIDFPNFVFNIKDEGRIEGYLDDILMKNINYKYESKPKSKIPKNEEELIFLDRGLNIILGKRGTGKTKLLTSILNEAKQHTDKEIFELQQNKIQEIITKGIWETEFSDEISQKKKFDIILKNQIDENLVNKIFDDFTFADIKIKELSEKIFNVIKGTIKNCDLDIVDKVENKFNDFFSSFNKENKALNDLIIVYNFISLHKSNKIVKSILNNIKDLKILKNEISSINDEEVKKIKIEYKKSISNRINKDIAIDELNSFLKKFNDNILNNETTYNNLISSIQIIVKKLTEEKSCKNHNITNFELKYWLNFDLIKNTEDLINKIGKKNGKKDLYNFLDDKIRNFKIWSLEKIELDSANKSTYFDKKENFIVIHYLNEKDISDFSPGQIVEEHISNVFKEIKYNIIIIDQPEDQLDAWTVSNIIIEPIKKIYDSIIKKGIQIIFVTHDPKIAINLGPTNIIECSVEDSKYRKNFFRISDIYDENTTNIIEKVDGKIEYVHERSKIYANKI